MEPMDLATPAHFTMGHRDSMMLAEDITALASQVSMEGAAPELRCPCLHTPFQRGGKVCAASDKLEKHLSLHHAGAAAGTCQ